MSELKTIIFIEDDPLDFEVYSGVIKDKYSQISAYRFDLFDMDFIKKFDPTETLLFLDINLSGVDGISHFFNDIKDSGYTTFVLTSSDNPQDILKAKEAGITSYFEKKSGQEEVYLQLSTIISFFNKNKITTSKNIDAKSSLFYKLKEKDDEVFKLRSEVSSLRSNDLYPGANSQLSLDESDALFTKIAKSFSAGIYIYDLNKRLNTYMNDEYTNITGHTLEEMNSLSSDEFISFFHPDDLQAVLSHMEQVSSAETDEVFKLEYRFKHKNGSWVKLLSLDRVFDRDKDNAPISFIGSFFSI